MLCASCKKDIPDDSVFCPLCGERTSEQESQQSITNDEKSKVVAGVFALILGGFGAHKFYLGYKAQAIITLIVTVGGLFLFGIPTILMAIVVLIEGIIYLTKTDQVFFDTYIKNKKAWF
jgi:TM2 domain-containing membrane protein YozV